MTSVNKDLTGVDASVAGVAAAAGSQVQQTSAAGASEAPLFEGTSSAEGVSTTDRTDAYIPSTQATGVKSAEMNALEATLAEKQSAVADIDSQIEANSAVKQEKQAAYAAAGENVTSSLSAYNTASKNYAAALSELNELKDANIFETIFNTITQKVKNAEAKVAQLKQDAEQARKDYEEAIEEREAAREEYTDSIKEGIELKQKRTAAQEEVATVQQQIQDLAKKEAESASETQTNEAPAEGGAAAQEGAESTQGANTSSLAALQKAAESNPELKAALELYGDNITEADIQELSAAYNVQLNAPETAQDTQITQPAAPVVTTPPADTVVDNSYLEDMALLDSLQQEAKKEAEEFAKQPNIFEFDMGDVDRIVELFCGELTHGEIQNLGLGLLDMVDEAAKIFETKLTATAYSKSGAMATTDTATTEEHSEAQSDFTEAVLQVSDIVNNNDVEFYNVSDQSNFELASRTLDRINEGEYIKTDTLEKQTSVVKNIRVVDKTTVDAAASNDEKYKQYSDAILGELHELIANSENGITEEEYNAIKTNFDLKASVDMESAFDYLEDEARKHNITSAINKYDK